MHWSNAPYYLSSALSLLIILGIAIRRGNGIPKWALALGLFLLALESLFNCLAVNSERPQDIALWQIRSLFAMAFAPPVFLIFAITYARHKELRPKPAWYLGIGALAVIPIIGVSLFGESTVVLVTMLDETAPWSAVLGMSGIAFQYSILLAGVLVLIQLERTYRAAVGTMRWRIKYMIIGLAVLMFVRIYSSSQAILYSYLSPSMNLVNSIGLIVSCILILRTLFRSGHFEIEVYPSQAVLQSSLAVFVVGAYLIVIGLFAKATSFLGGETAFPLKALGILVSLVLLGLLLQSDRFRLHLRQFVSRHFQRPSHDYRAVWRELTEETASHVNVPELCQSLATLISRRFDALSVNIWLVDENPNRFRLAASTAILTPQDPPGKNSPHTLDGIDSPLFSGQSHVNLDQKTAPWAEKIKAANPKKFPNGGDRIAIPMRVRNSILGFVLIGDRVGGATFTEQDFDILNSIGSHAASSLLNIELSGKLLASRELEAFQTMATFFVHDLKNAASTLNIMVKNLPLHWNNPEFQKDALRGITKTGDRINQIIGKLSAVQEGLEIDAAPTDLDELAESIVAGWQPPPGISLTRQFDSKAIATADRDQIGKVILNLIINASEAIVETGSIKVETKCESGFAVIVVTDDGEGMTESFVQTSLFRPFKTTKKTGLGIGMFQSKMIVEAHGGRLEVESKKGAGTTFNVLLPLASEENR